MALDINKIARFGPSALSDTEVSAGDGFSRGFNGDAEPKRRASSNPTPDDWKPIVDATRAAQPARDEEARQILLAEMANYSGPEENRLALYRDYAYRFGVEPTDDEVAAAGARQEKNVADSQNISIGGTPVSAQPAQQPQQVASLSAPADPSGGFDRVTTRAEEIRRMREAFAGGTGEAEPAKPLVPRDLVDRGNQPVSDIHGMLSEREQRERESAERGIAGDTAKTMAAGGLGMVGSLADLGYAATGADLLNKLGTGIGGAVEAINQSMSPEMRDASQRKFFAGNGETADAWTDPRAYWHAVFNGLGSMIPMLPMGALAGAGVRSASGVNALRAGFSEATAAAAAEAEAAAVAGRVPLVAAKAAAEKAGLAAGDAFLRSKGIEGGAAALAKREILAGTVGMTAAGTAMTAGDAANGAMEEVRAMPLDVLAAKSPEYRQALKELVDAGVPAAQAAEEAREIIVRAAGREAGALAAMLALPFNAASGFIAERLLSGTLGASTRLGNVGRAAAMNVPSEVGEEGLTQLSSNIGVRDNANPGKDITENVADAAIKGGIGALGMAAPHAIRKPNSPLSNAVAAAGGVPGAAVAPAGVPPASGVTQETQQQPAEAPPVDGSEQVDPELAAMVAAEQQDLDVRRDGMALAGQNNSRQDQIDALYDVEARPFEGMPDDVLVSTRGRVAKDVEKTVSKTGAMTAEQQVALRNLDYEINLRQGFAVQGRPEAGQGEQDGLENPVGNPAVPAQGDPSRGADLPGSGVVGSVGSDAGGRPDSQSAAPGVGGGRSGLAATAAEQSAVAGEIDYGVERDADGNVSVVARAWPNGPTVGKLQIPAAGITEAGFGIGDIYVGAAARRKGVGSAMVDRAERELGVPAAYSARQFNADGEAFFRGRQAKREADQKKQGDDLGKWFDETVGEFSGEQRQPEKEAPQAVLPAAQTEAPAAKAAPTAPPVPQEVSVTDIPPKLLKRITVPVERMVGDQVQTVDVSAREALDDLDQEISAYETLLSCVKAAA